MTNQLYYMNKFLLLLLLMPVLVVAQQYKPMTEDLFSKYDIKLKGHVKSVTMYEKKLFDSDSAFYKKNGYVNVKRLHGNNIVIKTIKYYPDGIIETSVSKDSIKQKPWRTENIYDLHNNLIEVDRYYQNGKKQIDISYHYDSLGRWIETRTYDTSNKLYITNKRVYVNNKVLVFKYYNDSVAKEKIVYEYDKNKTTKLTYHTDNEYCDKYIEKIKGNTIYRQRDWISFIDGRMYKQDIYQSNLTEGSSSEITYKENKEVRVVTKQQWKYNEYGDKTAETIFRSGFTNQKFYHNGYLIKTFKYIYDAHGNYLKKTEYIDGIPAIETNRTIEYYD